MKSHLLAIILILTSALASVLAAPDPGYYVGTVTITKGLGSERLLSTYTLKTQARIAADGTIAILTTVPEAPSAAVNVGSSVTRIAPVPPAPGDIYPPEPRPFAGYSHVVDGQYGADLNIANRVVTIHYQVPSIWPFVTTGPNSQTLQAPPEYTLFSFRLLKQKQP